MPRPRVLKEPRTVPIIFEAELYEKLEVVARSRDLSVSALIRMLAEREVRAHQEQTEREGMGEGDVTLKCALCKKGEAKYVLVEFALSDDLFTPACEACLEELKSRIPVGLAYVPLEPLALGKLIETANKRWQLAQECFWMLKRSSRAKRLE